MKKVFLAIVIIGMLGWVMYEYVFSPDTESLEEEFIESDKIGIRKGEIAPDFELTTLDGETIKLSDYRGQRIMLNIWATWCPPCRSEMPICKSFKRKKM